MGGQGCPPHKLYNPRRDLWHEHFRLEGYEFIPLTAIGRVTVRLLQINRKDRIEERQLLIKAGIFNIPKQE